MTTDIGIKFGDLTQEDVDFIVNPCSQDGRSGRCGQAILEKWPQAFEGVDFGGRKFCITPPTGSGLKPAQGDTGELRCRRVLHVRCSQRKEQLHAALDAALPELRRCNCRSIAFPIIGSGKAKRDFDQCSKELLEVLGLYFIQRVAGDVGFIQEVRVVVFDESMLSLVQSFYGQQGASMQSAESAQAEPEAGSLQVVLDQSSTIYREAVQRVPTELLQHGRIRVVAVNRSSTDAAAAALRTIQRRDTEAEAGGVAGEEAGGVRVLSRDELGHVVSAVLLDRRD